MATTFLIWQVREAEDWMARAESALAVYHSEDATLLKELSTLCAQV